MALPRRTDQGDWSAEIGRAAEAEMKGKIACLDPDAETHIPYDPDTDTGGYDEPALLFESKARIQQLGDGASASTVQQWATQRSFTIQIPLAATTMLIRKGLIIKVIDGGKDPALTGVSLTVISAINSTQAAVRTIQCVTALAKPPAVAAVPDEPEAAAA